MSHLRRYLCSLLSPPPTPSSKFPVDSHLTELHRFWKATFEDLLREADLSRNEALTCLRSQERTLSRAEALDLQSVYDGLVVEREELEDYAQHPPRLDFDTVSRASQYKSRAKSHLEAVKEVVRRSQAKLEAQRASGYGYNCKPSDTAPDHDRNAPRDPTQDGNGCTSGESPTPSDLSLSFSPGSEGYQLWERTARSLRREGKRRPLAAVSDESSSELPVVTVITDGSGSMLGSVSHASSHDQDSPRSPANENSLCYVLPPGVMQGAIGRPRDRSSSQSDGWETEETSGPATPRSPFHSGIPSLHLTCTPSFLVKLDQALNGIDTAQFVSEVNDMFQPIRLANPPSPQAPSHNGAEQQHDTPKPLSSRVVSDVIPRAILHFPPVRSCSLPTLNKPGIRRAAPRPRGPRRRPQDPTLSVTLEQLTPVIVELLPDRESHHDDEDDYGDILSGDCTITQASVVTQPYSHSRSNTLDVPLP